MSSKRPRAEEEPSGRPRRGAAIAANIARRKNIKQPAVKGTNFNKGLLSNNLPNSVPWGSKYMNNLRPYVTSRLWAQQMKNNTGTGSLNTRPTQESIYLALATSLGARYTTTGRGGGLEDAPFIPGVAAIPTIQRKLWATTVAYMPKNEIQQIMAGHEGIQGYTTPLNIKNVNSAVVVNNKRLAAPAGAITSFYRPAFTQVCVGNGEWLINGFKVDKAGINSLVETFKIDKGVVNLATAATGKGSTQAESDIAKFTIVNWPEGNSQNFSKAHLIVTIGEDKVGAGEASGAKGKEIAQLRYTLFAIYYMWQDLHRPDAPAHPWKKIPVENLVLEAVFLAAGAPGAASTVVSAQNSPTLIQIPGTRKYINLPVRSVDLNKFCAIFRLDRKRFAYAITNVNRKFVNGMSKYFNMIKKNMNAPSNKKVRYNLNRPNINLKVPLSSTNLVLPAGLPPFKPAILREPRKNMIPVRKKAELNWLKKVKNVGGNGVNRKSLNNAIHTFETGLRAAPGESQGASRGEGYSRSIVGGGNNTNMENNNQSGTKLFGVYGRPNAKTIERARTSGNWSGLIRSIKARSNLSNFQKREIFLGIARSTLTPVNSKRIWNSFNQMQVNKTNIAKKVNANLIRFGGNPIPVFEELVKHHTPANISNALQKRINNAGMNNGIKDAFNQWRSV